MTETVSRPAVLFMADEFDENAKVSRADNKLFSAQEWGYLAARLRALPATDTAENLKHAEALLSRIEALIPNWQGYRDIAEAVEVTLHHHRSLFAPASTDTAECERLRAALEENKAAIEAWKRGDNDGGGVISKVEAITLAALKDQGNG